MACFRKNRILDSQYLWGSDGYRRMFVRLAGTRVTHAAGAKTTAEESEIIIQWGGFPLYDSGYHAEYFPATMRGLRAARWRMKNMP